MISIGFICTIMMSAHKTASLLLKKHEFIMTQNRSWKFDENIFHQKCTKHHSLVTESVSGDDCDDISSKNHEFFMLFLT